ncbi:MAG: EI24 domain-containing protein [Sulfuriferula sp.]
MNDISIALWAAAKRVFHPKIFMIILWPMLFALVFWGVLSWVFWADWLASLNEWTRPASLFLQQYAFAWLAGAFSIFLLVLLIVPLALLTALLIATTIAMPMMVNFVAEKDFPDLVRYHGGTAVGSLWNALTAIAVFVILWLLTLPLWLVTGLGSILSVLLTAYLNQRLFCYDALSAHADRAEFELLMRQSNSSLYGIGLIGALLYWVPIVNLIAPVYVGLAYIYFSLARLQALRLYSKGDRDEMV